MKTIEKSRTIPVPKEKVWTVLLEDDYTKSWYHEFGEGVRSETDWIVGHPVKFFDAQDNGIFGKVLTKQPYDLIELEYDGVIVKGEEDRESEQARKTAGAREVYRLEEQDGTTVLTVTCDADERYFDEMAAAWDRALDKIAELSLAV
jgi:uncharacterized protein YndB with AHSA1/START domain